MIDPITYKLYSDCLSSLYRDEEEINDLLLEMYDEITTIDSSMVNISPFDFKSIIYRKYLDNRIRYVEQYRLLYSAVTALQLHVISNYSSLNNFLSDNGIIVAYYFAKASDRLGFTIDDHNVEYVLLNNGDNYIVE